MRRYFKPIFAVMLSLMLVLLPCIQDSKAVVTTTTLVCVLILTIMVAMGITLIVQGSKEAFLIDKGDEFMQSKGYSGTFQNFILKQNAYNTLLKIGVLYVAKDTTEAIKEFISWLLPNAQSNTVQNIVSGNSLVINEEIVFQGTLSQNGSFEVTKIGTFPSVGHNGGNKNVISDGVNTLQFWTASSGGSQVQYDGYYNSSTGVYTSNGNFVSYRYPYILIAMTDSFHSGNNNYLPGVYLGNCNTDTNIVTFSFTDRYFFNITSVYPEYIDDASAIIGNFNDLDDLVDTTVAGSGGTTVVYNTYYITQSGQALNPSSQDLADIVGALQQALDDINNRIGVIGMTVDAIAAQQVNPPYSDFQLGNLDFSSLGALLTTRFPFSIPWDLKRVFDVFVVEAEAPHWEINLFQGTSFGNQIDGTIEVDLGDYPIVGVVSRWFCIIDLCIFLAFCTKKLIWVA